MPTTFQTAVNNFGTPSAQVTLISQHNVSDEQLILSESPGTLSANRVWRITALEGANTSTETVLCIFEATGNSGAELTGVIAVEGFSDVMVPSGTVMQIRATAKTYESIQYAVNTLEVTAAGLGTASQYPVNHFLVTANNLSDVPSAASTRLNIGASVGTRTFGTSGIPTVSTFTPKVFLDRGFTCVGLTAACDTAPSGGPCTVVIQESTDGVTFTTLGTISITSGNYSATATLTSTIAANTYLRAEFTAVNSSSDITVILFLAG